MESDNSVEVIFQQEEPEPEPDPFANTTINLDEAFYPECVLEISLRGGEFASKNTPPSQPEEAPDKNEIILCILWRSGYLGAAYYNGFDSELYLISDIVDLSTDFNLTKTLYRQLKPTITITIGKLTSKFIATLSEVVQNPICEENESGTTSYFESSKSLPPQIQLLKKEEYSFELCEHTVKTMKLHGEPKNMTENERILRMNCFLNFERPVSVHALGALLLFLNKYRSVIETHVFSNITTMSIKDSMLIDDNALITLQIFSESELSGHFSKWQNSAVRNKDDCSLFKTFNKCRSSLGRNELRYLLLHPTNSLTALQERQDFIEFCTKPVNIAVVNGIRQCLKNIYPIASVLRKMEGNQANLFSWKSLYTTIQNILLMEKLCQPYINEIKLFEKFNSQVDSDLEVIKRAIFNVIDFEHSVNKKLSVRVGIDKELDEKRIIRMELDNKISIAAKYEVRNLPPYVNVCCMLYIPQIGYLVAVHKWNDNARFEDIEPYGFQHKFTVGNIFNFKSPLCYELDESLGDIYTEILVRETQVLYKLGQEVVLQSYILKKPLKLVALFDCLICMSEVANEFNYVRPNLIQDNIINIQDGRHPLLEIYNANFVPNNFVSGGENSVMKIITGPNNSGKSIYLKQVALLVYLAHIGSFVPASAATIGMMYSINCCIANDPTSTCSKLSTFATNMRQLTEINSSSRKNSLIIIDELGRATTKVDGISILTAHLEFMLYDKTLCPHVLVSTHYFELTKIIKESKYFEHLKCGYKLNGDDVLYLYKIEKGVSKSFGILMAKKVGLPENIIKRSREILKSIQKRIPLEPVNSNK